MIRQQFLKSYIKKLLTNHDSKKSFEEFPHIKNGTHIKNDKLVLIDNLYLLNGVGGRGFVLSLYLANKLVENIVNGSQLEEDYENFRLFNRWAKKPNKGKI